MLPSMHPQPASARANAYRLERFRGPAFARVNAILDAYTELIDRRVNLIASASYPFAEVVQALANPFFLFPCEGLPGERYFPASGPLDAVETEAEQLARELFCIGDDYGVTIQPHSGTQANQIAFNSVLAPDDVVLSLRPSHGGHVSHTVLVGRRNRVVYYDVTAGGAIDYDGLAAQARAHRPRLIIAGGSSLQRAVDYARIGEIAREVGAQLHADISHTALFHMAGVHPSPFPHAATASFNTMKNLRGPCGGVLVHRSDARRDIARALFPGTQGGPVQSVLFAKLVCFAILRQTDLRAMADGVISRAIALAGAFLEEGLSVVGGGTESHLVLVDLRHGALSGLDAERLCEANGILANRNLVPGDTRRPAVTSGLRFGTSCIASLGWEPDDVTRLGRMIAGALLRGEPLDVAPFLARYQEPA